MKGDGSTKIAIRRGGGALLVLLSDKAQVLTLYCVLWNCNCNGACAAGNKVVEREKWMVRMPQDDPRLLHFDGEANNFCSDVIILQCDR